MTERKKLSAEDCLNRITPPTPSRRFLQWFDTDHKELWFGLGSGDHALQISSGRKLELYDKAEDISPSRLMKETVLSFRSDGGHVTGRVLFEQCRAFQERYLYFKDERLYDLVTIWAIGTYLYTLFSHFGYLFFHSKHPRSGKTRTEEILFHLSFNATVPLNAPTVPSIRDTAAQGWTVQLDTLERWRLKNSESYFAAMELLDAGFRKGGTVPKQVKADDGKWRREMFPVYAPYVLAAINKGSLSETALDRSFVVEMHRKPIVFRKQKYNFDICEKECQPLRSDLYRWALQNAPIVAETYESQTLDSEIDALELNDRASDIWKPLFATAHVLGVVGLLDSLQSLAIEMGHDVEAAERKRIREIVRGLRILAGEDGVVRAMTSALITHLQTRSISINERQLHSMLIQWGFAQGSTRLEEGPRRAWELEDSKLAQIEQDNRPLYTPSENLTTVTTPDAPMTEVPELFTL